MPTTTQNTPTADDMDDGTTTAPVMSNFHRYRRTLVATEDNEGWEAELWQYLKDMPADVTPKTDIVKWWQVHSIHFNCISSLTVLSIEQSQGLSHPGTHFP